MKNDAMLEALRRKKAGGVDLTIILGGPAQVGEGMVPGLMGNMEESDEEKEEREEDGRAPEATELKEDGVHEDEEQDKALIEKELKKASYGKMPLFGKKSSV